MGLDAYLYRTTKKRIEALDDFDQKNSKYRKWLGEYFEYETVKKLFESLPKVKSEYGEMEYFDWDGMTDKQRSDIEDIKAAIRSKAKEIGFSLNDELKAVFDPCSYGLDEDETNPYEIQYFDRDWELHNFIVDHYWNTDKNDDKSKKNDNLTRIPLTSENLKEIAKAGFYPDVFKFASETVDENHVVYYYAWY